MKFSGKTAFITGASRGIGKAIALKLAADGANIVVAAKSIVENPKLGGTIFSAVEEIEAAGGKGFAVQLDIRDEAASAEAIAKAAAHFGGIDFLINNASAISLTPTPQTDTKRYDLMQDINVRGTYFLCQAALPWLKKSSHAHILTLSPPLNMAPKWFAKHLAYTISKYNMSMIAFGLAAELKPDGIGVNALWPKTTIATAAVNNLLGGEMLMNMSRTPEIIADSVWHILQKNPANYTGQFLIDEEVLMAEGVTDLSSYAYVPGNTQFYPDLFLG